MGRWEAVIQAGPDLARWVGRVWIGGRKGVRIVPAPMGPGTAYQPPDSPHALALMRVEARLYVTNVSPHRPVKFVGVELRKGHNEGVVGPYLPIPPWAQTMFEQTGQIASGTTEQVECKFWFGLDRNKRGGFTAEPWTLRSRIVLTDQYGRKHRTRKLYWRR